VSDETAVRAGLWPRFMALAIDGCLIAVVLGVLGMVLFGLTGGRIRVENMPMGSQSCTSHGLQILQDLEISLPANFQVTRIIRCDSTFLGRDHDRVLLVAGTTRSATIARELKYPLDSEGRPMRAFYLDSLGFLIFAAYVLSFESRTGKTLGKDLMDIRVRPLAGGSLTFIQVFKRFFVRFFPGILVAVLPLLSIADVTFATAPTLFWFTWGASLLSALAIDINTFMEVRQKDLPWHDYLAGTEVVVGR
jgi:uncharacterized RDD family membrane protein YckC